MEFLTIPIPIPSEVVPTEWEKTEAMNFFASEIAKLKERLPAWLEKQRAATKLIAKLT